jgi:hypothetical protein
MPLQHHFIVIVEDGKIFIDHETTDHKFYEKSVWDTDTETWEDPYDNHEENEKAQELLWNKINREDK